MYGALWALSEGKTEGYNECARSKVSPLSDDFNHSYDSDTDLDRFCDEIHFPQSKEKMTKIY